MVSQFAVIVGLMTGAGFVSAPAETLPSRSEAADVTRQLRAGASAGEKPSVAIERRVKRVLVEVASVDAANRRIVYSDADAPGCLLSDATAAGDAIVTVDGQGGTLRDIPRGGIAVLTTTGLWPDSRRVAKVDVTGPTLIGSVEGVGATTVTVAWEASLTDPSLRLKYTPEVGKRHSITEAQFEETFVHYPRVLGLAAGGTVLADGKAQKLSALKPGTRVRVTVTSDRSKILSVTSGEAAESGARGRDRDGPERP